MPANSPQIPRGLSSAWAARGPHAENRLNRAVRDLRLDERDNGPLPAHSAEQLAHTVGPVEEARRAEDECGLARDDVVALIEVDEVVHVEPDTEARDHLQEPVLPAW